METSMLPESPGPKSSTVTTELRDTMVPVLSAEPAEVVVAPNACALGAVPDAGAETMMSFPEMDWPAPRVITVGGFTGPTLGGGVGVGLGGGLFDIGEEECPAHPLMAARAMNKIVR